MFSNKMFFILFAVSCASLAFAITIPRPVGIELASRDTTSDILGIVNQCLGLVTSILDLVKSLAGLGKHAQAAVVNQVNSALTASTTSLLAVDPSSLGSGDLRSVVNSSVKLIIQIATVTFDLGLQNITLDRSTDTALSGWVTALDATSPGIAPEVGKGVESSNIDWTQFTKAFRKTGAILQG